MFRLILSLISILSFAGRLPSASAIVNFFPYGSANGDASISAGDDTFASMPLATPFRFLGVTYNATVDSVYVNVNGAVSFHNGVSQYTPTCGATNTPMVAPFWADVDIRAAGIIYYRQTSDPNVLSRIRTDTVNQFSALYYPPSAIIATWVNVPFFNCGNNPTPPSGPRNTFQLVMASDPYVSIVEFLYGNITWTTGGASGGNCTTGLGGVPAKVGFDAGDGQIFYAVDSSCTPGVANIGTTTDMNNAGQWIFSVGYSYQETCPGVTNPISRILQIFASILLGTVSGC